jgi:hypothetical protein
MDKARPLRRQALAGLLAGALAWFWAMRAEPSGASPAPALRPEANTPLGGDCRRPGFLYGADGPAICDPTQVHTFTCDIELLATDRFPSQRSPIPPLTTRPETSSPQKVPSCRAKQLQGFDTGIQGASKVGVPGEKLLLADG